MNNNVLQDTDVLISVIMPVYNVKDFIQDSICSILNQTVTNFELIIIDDCSNDGTAEIIESILNFDDRISIFHNSKNMGLVYSLNYGLMKARGRYIARMDGDDISHPRRFENQIAYFERNTDVILCGTWTRNFGKNNYEWHVKDNRKELKYRMMFHPVLAHPSFMFRRELFENNGLLYNFDFFLAEDYAFAVESLRFGNIGVLQKERLRYRVHDKQISYQNYAKQKNIMMNVRKKLIEQMDLNMSIDDLKVLGHIGSDEKIDTFDQLFNLYNKVVLIINKNASSCTLKKVFLDEFALYAIHNRKLIYIVRLLLSDICFYEKICLIKNGMASIKNKINRHLFLYLRVIAWNRW